MVFSEATIIQDRNGETLYKLYDENREYVDYTGISLNMVNAIVAIEDQRYREHNGLDAMGMLRAGLKALVNPGSRVQGASTIPQQLIRNLLLTKDRKVTRKLKEIILTSRLDGVLEKQIRATNAGLSSAELRKQMKIKTLELYLNYISFGNNAFGVETASRIYFGKSATGLTVLEASVLASLPKWPSLYNPYKNRWLVVWEFSIKDNYGNKAQVDTGIQAQINSRFADIVMKADFGNKTKDNAVIKYMKGIGAFDINVSGTNLKVQFINGRKDLVLTRMYEDGYINEAQLKEAIVQWLDYKFRSNAISMLAPHFVQRVIEELEKNYDTGTLFKWGFIVKTSLDLKIQKEAELAMQNNNPTLQNNGANNSSMIYFDSKNGDVLAYVGSMDYFNLTIEGQNDMVRRPRQSGSSIKPFIYALALETLPLTLDTPIFDIPFQIGKDKPNNADDSFEWLLPLKLALGHSRNIPSAKMITALWWELVAKPFLQKLWLSGVSDNIEYGYTLALGAAEVTMMEMANGYAHLSTDTPAEINPILEIRTSDGSILYQKTGEKLRDEVVKPGVRFLMWKILSDPANRIIGWVSKFNVAWLTFGLKTGTSNAKTPKGNRPRDGWLAAYTPSKVALFRAGNADGTPMNVNAFGWTIHATPLKQFFWFLLKNNYITNEAMPEKDTAWIQISKISGKLASPATPAEFVVSTLKYAGAPSPAVDEWAIGLDYDASCNGLLSPYTANENIKKGYLITPTSFMPNGMDIKEITQRRTDSTNSSGRINTGAVKITYNYPGIFVAQPQNMCDGSAVKEDQTIQVQLSNPGEWTTISTSFSVSYGIQATKNIRKVIVLLDGQTVATFDYPQGNTKSITDTKQVTLIHSGFKNGNYTLQLVAFDFAGFSNKKDISVKLDKGAPPTPQTNTGKANPWTGSGN